MLGDLSLDTICSSKLTVFLELRSRKIVLFSEEIMSADKYPSIFSGQMEVTVCIFIFENLILHTFVIIIIIIRCSEMFRVLSAAN